MKANSSYMRKGITREMVLEFGKIIGFLRKATSNLLLIRNTSSFPNLMVNQLINQEERTCSISAIELYFRQR